VFIGVILVVAVGLTKTRFDIPNPEMESYKELQVNNFVARNIELASTMFLRPVFNEKYYNTFNDPMTKYDLYTFIVFKSDKFMIIRLPETNLDSPYIAARGDRDATYSEFLDEVKTIKHGICLIWLKVEHIERLVVVRYITPGTARIVGDAYPDQVSLNQEMGFVRASSVDELKLETVLQKVKEIFKFKSWEQDKTGVDDLTRIFNMAEDIQLPTSNMVIEREGNPVITNQLFYKKIGEIMNNHTVKYVVSSIRENNTIDVISVGNTGATYIHFLEALNSPKFRLGVLDFVYEGVHQPIAVVWEPKQLKQELRSSLFEELEWMIGKSIPIMAPKSMLEMNLNFMIEYGAEDDPVKRQQKAKEVKETLLHL
jgi:hypothetical protein